MVKTLRIMSYLLAAGALCGVVLIIVLGFRGDPGIEVFLDQKGVVERLKTQIHSTPEEEDSASPLVAQAQAFALRIDPPPPPPPPASAARPEPARPTPRPEPVRPPVVTPPQASGRYSLLATARFEANPERSLALLKPVTGAAKWHREGETVGHLEIHEIRDGSVVLYQAGRMNSELFVPKPTTQPKSLLKSDAVASTGPAASSRVGAAGGFDTPAEAVTLPGPDGDATGPIRVPRGATRTPPSRTVDAAARVQRVTASRREPTREEQKESIQQSIESIEDIMARSGEAHVSDEERKQEQEAWTQLLQILQQEKTVLESGAPAENGSASEPDAPPEENTDHTSSEDATESSGSD